MNEDTLLSITGTSTTQYTACSYDVEATGPDTIDTLTYSLTTGPDGMNIATTVVIGWTFTNAQVGANALTVRVQDVASATVTQGFPAP